MNREIHVRFRGSRRVRPPPATRPSALIIGSLSARVPTLLLVLHGRRLVNQPISDGCLTRLSSLTE